MTHDDIRKLLGGYSTGTLTPEEQRALFAAALEDQELFDALAREQALRDLLRDPAARAHVLASLDETPQPWWRPAVRWLMRPAVAGAMAACLAVAMGYGIWRARQARPPVLVAVNRELRTAPVEPARPAPSAVAVPVRQEERPPAVGAMGDAGRRADRSAPVAAAPEPVAPPPAEGAGVPAMSAQADLGAAGAANRAAASETAGKLATPPPHRRASGAEATGTLAFNRPAQPTPPRAQAGAGAPAAQARVGGSAAGAGGPAMSASAGAANRAAARGPVASETVGKPATPPPQRRASGAAATGTLAFNRPAQPSPPRAQAGASGAAQARVGGSAAGPGGLAAPGSWAMDRVAQSPPPQLQAGPNVVSAPKEQADGRPMPAPIDGQPAPLPPPRRFAAAPSAPKPATLKQDRTGVAGAANQAAVNEAVLASGAGQQAPPTPPGQLAAAPASAPGLPMFQQNLRDASGAANQGMGRQVQLNQVGQSGAQAQSQVQKVAGRTESVTVTADAPLLETAPPVDNLQAPAASIPPPASKAAQPLGCPGPPRPWAYPAPEMKWSALRLERDGRLSPVDAGGIRAGDAVVVRLEPYADGTLWVSEKVPGSATPRVLMAGARVKRTQAVDIPAMRLRSPGVRELLVRFTAGTASAGSVSAEPPPQTIVLRYR